MKPQKTKLQQCRPAPWDIPTKYLGDYYQENNEHALTYLRKLPLFVTPGALLKMKETKVVVVQGAQETIVKFTLAPDGEYYDGKKSLTKFLLEVHDRNPGTIKTKVQIL